MRLNHWFSSRLSRFTVAVLAAAITLGLIAPAAHADDVVRLKTGETVRGEIVRELDGSVWLVESFGTVKRERFFASSQIESVERDAEAVALTEETAPAARSNVPKGAVISLEGMVGLQMASDELRRVIPMLEQEIGSDGTGILVLKINSGGGALIEIQRLSDVIQNELKPRFQVVAWIESAISAAAMTSHAIEAIYFMPQGNYGACTGWSGALTAVKGIEYEQVVFTMEKISDRGGYDHSIMRAMQGHWNESHHGGAWPLSCTIADDGTVTFYQDADSGEIVLNPEGEVLTLNSVVAKQIGFSKGTAGNLEELTKALGYEEIEWVGKPFEGRIYPVCRAEAEMIRYRDKVTEDEERLQEYWSNYNINLEAARGVPQEMKGRFVGNARKHLRSIESMVRNSPNFALFQFNILPDDFKYWVEEREQELRDAMGP